MAKKQFFIESELVFAEKLKDKRFQDLTGQKFGRETVIGFAGVEKRQTHWFCKCQCGNITKIQRGHLKNGTTTSCGCVLVEWAKETMTTHGQTINGKPSKTYKRWESMKDRCQNPKHKSYKNYGGRGITFCNRWEKFENFLADMGECPEGLSLERKENDKGYFKENCKWANWFEQANNRRSNHLITYNDKTQTMTQWAEEISVRVGTLWNRLNLGWPIERALTKNNLKINLT